MAEPGKRIEGIARCTSTRLKKTDGFEVHGADLRRGEGHFKGIKVAQRIAFRDAWMKIAANHGVRLIYRSAVKKQYAIWLNKMFGQGVLINPHVVVFAMIARCVDDYLRSLPGLPLGILISDENKEVVADVEKSISIFRGDDGKLRLTQIVEKGFFIDSTKSFPLQLCDLFAMSARKMVERQNGFPPKSIDDSGIAYFQSLLHSDRQNDGDVLKWLTKNQKHRKSHD